MDLFVLLSLLLPVTASAQQAEEMPGTGNGQAVKDLQESRWTVKPMAGMTLTTLVGSDASDVSSAMGWGLGLEGECRLSRWLGLSFGAIYTINRFNSDEKAVEEDTYWNYRVEMNDPRYKQEHIQVPLLLNIYPAKGLTLKAGLQPSLLLSAQAKVHIGGYRAKTEEILGLISPETIAAAEKVALDYDQTVGIRSELHKTNLLVPVGASYEWRGITLDVRYHFGLFNESKNDDAQERYLMVTLGYKFNM